MNVDACLPIFGSNDSSSSNNISNWCCCFTSSPIKLPSVMRTTDGAGSNHSCVGPSRLCSVSTIDTVTEPLPRTNINAYTHTHMYHPVRPVVKEKPFQHKIIDTILSDDLVTDKKNKKEIFNRDNILLRRLNKCTQFVKLRLFKSYCLYFCGVILVCVRTSVCASYKCMKVLLRIENAEVAFMFYWC